MKMIPPAIRKVCLLVLLVFLSLSVFAQSPSSKILYVGAISINPCQDARVLADWYARFGIETKEFHGGYYGKLDTARSEEHTSELQSRLHLVCRLLLEK